MTTTAKVSITFRKHICTIYMLPFPLALEVRDSPIINCSYTLLMKQFKINLPIKNAPNGS